MVKQITLLKFLGIVLLGFVFIFSNSNFCGFETPQQLHPQTLAEPERPNIIFVLVDDMGWGDVGFNGAEFRTKHIDALARSGVILNHHYVDSICAPTRVSFMTGRQSCVEVGMCFGVFMEGSLAAPTRLHRYVSEEMQELGYATHMIGKWHLGNPTWDDTPLERGFDSFLGVLCARSNHFTYENIADVTESVTCKGEQYKFWKGEDVRETEWGSCLIDGMEAAGSHYYGEYQTTLYSRRAVDIIKNHGKQVRKQRKRPKPLFVLLAHQAVHSPIQAPFKYINSTLCSTSAPTSDGVNQQRQVYCGMIQALDEGIGDIASTLRDEGLLDDTIIIFTSDNGAPLEGDLGFMFGNNQVGSNWPLRGGKSTLWEGGSRVPTFIWGSAIRKDSLKGYDAQLQKADSSSTQVIDSLFHVRDWFLTLPAMGGRTGRDTLLAKKYLKGRDELLVSAYNQWDYLRRATEIPPPRRTMIYNALTTELNLKGINILEVGAIRNSHYKYVRAPYQANSGWFNPVNMSKTERYCLDNNDRSRDIPLCTPEKIVDLLFKISEDETEHHPLDLGSLSPESRENFNSLKKELEAWWSISTNDKFVRFGSVPSNIPRDAQSLPRYNNCTIRPFLSTPTFPIEFEDSCKDSRGIICPSEIHPGHWKQFAG